MLTMFGRRESETANAINNLATAIYKLATKSTERMEKLIMGLKEDFDNLNTKFDGLESASLAVADDIAALKREIVEANERANIDLSPLVARAEGIEAGLRAAAGSQPGSDTTTTGPTEPTT